jgi:hypothetical protein
LLNDFITKLLSNVEPKEEFNLDEAIKRIILSLIYSRSLKLENHKFAIILKIFAVSETLSPNHITNAHLGLKTKLFDKILSIILLAFLRDSSFSEAVISFIFTRFDKSSASVNKLLFLEKSSNLYIL